MGVGVILAVTAVSLLAASVAFAVLASKQGNADSLGPELSEFKPTTTKDGMVVPVIYGRVRTQANLIFWDNLEVVEIRQKAEGGKGGGGGGGSQVTGHKYYSDVWQGIGIGKLSIVKTFIEDKETAVEASSSIFNDGTDVVFPAIGDFAAKINPISHIYYQRWFMGENRSLMPTIHFVVDRILTHGLNNENLANGSNPSAVIYDILVLTGTTGAQLNITSFDNSGDFWFGKGYGLNFKIDSRSTAANAIKKVLGWVDAVLFIDGVGRYNLNALDETQTFADTITEADTNFITYNRKAWVVLPNDFFGTYQDESEDFTQRSAINRNPAAIRLARRRIKSTRDFKCFRDKSTVSKRLFEIKKKQSYPIMRIRIGTNNKFFHLIPGQILRVNNSDEGIIDADFRVVSVDTKGVNKNEIEIEAEQQIETLFDDTFITIGGSNYIDVKQDFDLIPFTKIKIIELPYNDITGFDPSFLTLVSRELQIETFYQVLVSDNPTSDFFEAGLFSTFSMQGILDVAYPDTTLEIDDTVGIEFTQYQDNPAFQTITQDQLFAIPRVVVIGDEFMVFEKFVPQGGGVIRLEGVARGVFGTTKASHSIGAEVYITFVSNNILKNIPFDDFYVKLLPVFQDNIVPAGLVTAVNVTKTGKALQPRDPGMIVVDRTGTTLDVQVNPSTPGVPGAGDKSPVETDTEPPYAFDGDFAATYGATVDEIKPEDSFSITVPVGAIDVTVKSRFNNRLSTGKTVSVGASDGQYTE